MKSRRVVLGLSRCGTWTIVLLALMVAIAAAGSSLFSAVSPALAADAPAVDAAASDAAVPDVPVPSVEGPAAGEEAPAAAPAVSADSEKNAAEKTADQSKAETTESDGWKFVVYWLIAFAGSIAALIFAFRFYKMMMAADPGNDEMVEIAGHVRTGANAYIWQQYKVVAMFFVAIVILLSLAAFWLGVQSKFVPFAFLSGGFFSGLAGWFGMKTATWASSRTAAGCRSRSTRACKSPSARGP